MGKDTGINVSWEEARLLIFNKIDGIDEGIKDLKKSLHQEFANFKDEFAKANDVRHKEMQNEIDLLKKNQFNLLQKDKENEGKLSGKKAVYAVVGTTVALLVSVVNMILEFFK